MMEILIVVVLNFLIGTVTFGISHRLHWGYWTKNPFDHPELFEKLEKSE